MPEASDFGQPISWWPLVPALLILIFPLGFRLTCYYYYASLLPLVLAVAAGLRGRRAAPAVQRRDPVPVIMQNAHRYFWYVALIFGVILTYDAVLGFRNPAGEWGHMGLGTVFLLVNAGLIWAYTLSCHSCRHIMGGKLMRHFSRHPIRYKAWQQISRLNARHMQLAWASLIWLALTDL